MTHSTAAGLEQLQKRLATQLGELAPLDVTFCHAASLASLIALNETEEFAAQLAAALDEGLSPIVAREIVIQSAVCVGFARAKRFWAAAQGVFNARGLSVPESAPDSDTTALRAKGSTVQRALFGEDTASLWQDDAEAAPSLGRLMTENCFGALYARDGLSLKLRELVTFCCLAASCGNEMQLKAHIVANDAAGNDEQTLTAALLHCLPNLGWPRTLAALSVLTETEKELKNDGYDDDPF